MKRSLNSTQHKNLNQKKVHSQTKAHKESNTQITIELNKQKDLKTCANLRKKQLQLVVHV